MDRPMFLDGSHKSWIGYAIAAAILIVVVALRLFLGRKVRGSKPGSFWLVSAACAAVIAYIFAHFRSDAGSMLAVPVAQAPLWLFQALALVFVALIVRAMMRRKDESGARQDAYSRVGIAIQSISFVIVAIGPVTTTLPSRSGAGVLGFAAVLLLMTAVIGLFGASSSALGKNWSIKARTLSDHELVRSGPYAHVRHPIYLAMLLFLLAMAIAVGHWFLLIVALPIFMVGTAMRTTAEDRLLEASFGQEFIEYRNSTPGLFPRIG